MPVPALDERRRSKSTIPSASEAHRPPALHLPLEQPISSHNEISPYTLKKLLQGGFPYFQEVVIVDARFEYEYQAGHIRSAINLWRPQDIEKQIFQKLDSCQPFSRVAIVVHCEFSKERGPRQYDVLRRLDREINGADFYPNLIFPELYLLRGGFKRFFEEYPEICTTGVYLPMHDARHNEARAASETTLFKCRSVEHDRSLIQALHERLVLDANRARRPAPRPRFSQLASPAEA
jgi:M-phase inducer phosphatase 3